MRIPLGVLGLAKHIPRSAESYLGSQNRRANADGRRRELVSVLQLTREHKAEHAKVADKRPPRMSERRRLIAFDEKVTSPGKAVPNGNPEQSPDVVASCIGPYEYGQPNESAAGMKQAVSRARVLLQVEGEEFVIRGESILLRFCHGIHRTTPSRGELAVAYNFLGMRPARYALRPASTAWCIASAISTGSPPLAIAACIGTASAPSSIATVASEAVPTAAPIIRAPAGISSAGSGPVE